MLERLPRGWWLTTGLAALALVGALAARSVSLSAEPDAHEIEADPCFRYGRLECCIRENE